MPTKSSKKLKNNNRPTWDEYFMQLARVVSSRNNCDRGTASSVIVKGKHILTTGYVGAPAGLPTCDEVGQQLKKTIHEDGKITEHCVRTIHAEQNAILQAAKLGIAIDGATLYCNMAPCRTCAMLLIGAGIKRVVAAKKYHAGEESAQMLKKAGVKIEFLSNEIEEYGKK
jgi:dCMP deaminase